MLGHIHFLYNASQDVIVYEKLSLAYAWTVVV